MISTAAPRLLLSVFASCLGGCGAKNAVHDQARHGHGHSHEAKHGGVAVALGDEEFHIEFTHGSSPGIISAYFLDAHMEDYVRLDAPSFSASVVIDGRSQAVVFAAVSNVATGEKIGDSSLFEGRIVGLPDHPALLVSVPALIVKGRTYANIKARLPAK